MNGLGPGGCSETRIATISNLFVSVDNIINPDAFLNPQVVNIANMLQGSTNAGQQVDAYLIYLNSIQPPPPNLGALLKQATDFQAALLNFDNTVLRYEKWTNFLSGKSSVFPMTELDSQALFPSGTPQGYAMLGTLGFAGMIGAVKGVKQSEHLQCTLDPNDPCASINKVIGAVMGAFDTALEAIATGLNAMIDFVNEIANYAAQLTAAIDAVVAIVAEAITELAAGLVKLLRDGLALALDNLKLDPCISALLGNVAGPDLKAALEI